MQAQPVIIKSYRWPLILLVAGLMAVILVASAGIRSGNQASFTLLYLVPVTLSAWLFGRHFGIMTAIAGTVSSLLPETATTFHYNGHLDRGLLVHGLIVLVVFLGAAFWLARIRSALSVESRLARTDFTTGAVNKRHFYQMGEIEIRRFNRYRRTFSVALMDLDNFKAVNDTWGHAAGDRALCRVSQTLADNLRDTDTVARLSGDEFALLLPETDAGDARTVIAHSHRKLLQAMRDSRLPVTFSIGLVTFRRAPASVDEMLHRADEMMYRAKRMGKNRIESRVLPASRPGFVQL